MTAPLWTGSLKVLQKVSKENGRHPVEISSGSFYKQTVQLLKDRSEKTAPIAGAEAVQLGVAEGVGQ